MTKLAVDAASTRCLAIAARHRASASSFGFAQRRCWSRGIRLPPFIVTLGTLNIAFALTHIYSQDEQTVTDLPCRAMTLPRATRSRSAAPTVTYGSCSMLALFVVAWFVLRRPLPAGTCTRSATTEAARLIGIPTAASCSASTSSPALLYGIAALLLVARTGVGDPNAGQTDNLDSITAVVLGGTSLFGGRGTVIGTLIGALIVGVFRNGLTLIGVDAVYQVADHRHPGHPRRRGRPARPEPAGGRDREPPTPTSCCRRAGWSSATATSPRSTAPTSSCYPGEILAVIGDNGAGKSTLIKALSGAIMPDEGEIRLDGEPVHFRTPLDARRAGIETVYQDLAVAPALDIADEPVPRPRAAAPRLARLRSAHARQARDASTRHARTWPSCKIGIRSMTQAVETLSGGQRQGVAVARAAACARQLVIMDEPTAALGVKESGMVLDLIRQVRDRGLPVILISHNMPHVFEVADRIHIQRLGRRVAVVTPQDVTPCPTPSRS